MKTITVFVLAVAIAGSSAFLIKVPTAPTEINKGPTGWVHLQKLILPLFENVCEDSTDPVIVRLAQNFTLVATSAAFVKPEVIENFKTLQTKGLLQKGEIFTNYDPNHINELKIIYEVLYYAKNFDTFLTAASWARQNVNCGLFVNAIYLALLNRRDTEKLSVPAPYELIPNYFIQKDVIIKASTLLSGEEVILSDTVRDEGNSYVLDANYTADFVDNDDESKLAYFHEDIGLNTYYFLQKLRKSFWFNTTPTTDSRYGEYLYHMMKQLVARYGMERYANGLPEVESVINWDTFRVAPYDPLLIYSNGNEFGHRISPLDTTGFENLQFLETIENNIATVVTHMKDTGYNKTEILNHVMSILVTEERSFETVLRSYVGKDNLFTKSQPSVLDHYMTSLRDPIFWRLNQKIVDLVDNALKVFPTYTRNELYFPGVEILNVDVKKMMTNFDYFQFDVTDALKTASTNTAFQVKIGQPRLNHKPFVVKVNISSLVTQKGLVKIYLGPKIAPGDLALKKNLFMLLDNFECNLKIGTNVLTRSSEEMTNLSNDFTSLKTFRKNIEDAEFGLNSLPLEDIESLTGFPSRLILPKGTPEGLPLQIFVFVAPFIKTTISGLFASPNVEFNSAVMSPGYPLDLDITESQLFDLPNVIVKDVLITHKGDKVSNFGGTGGTKKWQTKSDYAANRKEPFDYSSKKGQYGKKEGNFDYSAKKGQYGKKNDYPSTKDDSKDTDIVTNTNDNGDINSDVIIKDLNEYAGENVIDDKTIRIVELEKDDDDVFTEKPVKQQEGSQLVNDDISDNYYAKLYSFLTTAKKPSVYDYITSRNLNNDELYPDSYEIHTNDEVYY